jgi:hypothetical protein
MTARRRWRVAPAAFEAQLAHLLAAGFRSISLREWIAAYEGDAAALSRRAPQRR